MTLAPYLLFAALVGPAWADDGKPDPSVLDEFETLPDLSHHQHRWLKPDRGALEPVPRSQTDFTAYTLELGEVRLGVARWTVGALPRVEVGTVPTLDVLGVYNGHAKLNLVTVGPLDLAIKGNGYALPLGEFLGTYTSLGGMASVVLSPWASVHGGGSWSLVQFDGIPDPSRASPLIFRAAGEDPADWALDPEGVLGVLDPHFAADAVWVEAALDLRLNRRDSLVIRGNAMVWARVRADLGVDWEELDLPPIAGLDEALTHEGAVPVRHSYTATFAYQASWRNLDLRAGVGMSAVPWAWLLQSMEVAWRFGGRTRRTEAKMKRGWRESRDDVDDAADRLAAI